MLASIPALQLKRHQWDRWQGQGQEASRFETQLVSLLGEALGPEQGEILGEELPVRVVTPRLLDGAHFVILENDLVPWVQQRWEQQEKQEGFIT
jgi:hypothetical protein